ncbi:MAG: Hpt domain-containing protein, partial [Planctomycetota bacterium]
MGLKASIEAAAKAAVLTDSADLQGLVSLGEILKQVAADAAAEGASSVAASSNQAAELAEQIIFRQVDDVERAFRALVEAVGACEQAAEAADAPRREPADPELLAAWVAGCDASLPELEHLTVTAESQGFEGETAADIRRRIHTLKGECGVLSLSEAQTLCHEVESAIDAAKDRFPAELVLALCDWMKSLTQALTADPAAGEPDARALRSMLAAPATATPTRTAAAPKPVPTSGSPAGTGSAAAPEALAPAATDPFADLAAIPADQRVAMNLENADENLGDFATEAREHLANAENAVLALEANPTDAEQVNVVFRAFHTIKGVAGFLNLPRVVEVAHAAEFLLDKVRSNKLPLSAHVLELVLASADLLGQLIGMLGGGEAPKERELRILVRRLEAACEGRNLPAPGATATAADTAPLSTATAAETAPSAPTAASSTAAEPTAAATPANGNGNGNGARAGSSKADQTVKVSTQRMDALVNLVGELVIAQLMVVQDPVVGKLHDQRVQRNLAHLGKIVRDLQETSMSLRMVTLRATFQKMARLVRDVSAKAGKRIALEVEGEDVELDRNVV